MRAAGSATDGEQAPGAPNVQFNIAGERDRPFARGLTLNGRLTYTRSHYLIQGGTLTFRLSTTMNF